MGGLRRWKRCLFVLAVFPALSLSAPELQFSFGRVQGQDKLAEDTGKPYSTFYGIPFAQPPVGGLRFRAPRPFVGAGPNVVISSNGFRAGCEQQRGFQNPAPNSEDCLYLNGFTPSDVSNTKKVMFWIHGGRFVAGDASLYVPSQLVTDIDVIVVTTQYRLGPFAYLSSRKKDSNNGLRDQILALKWVKDNIAQFGGDPNDITIFGGSAGSLSVSLLSISPLTKGLFSKAIMQSGTAISTSATNSRPEELLYQAADRLGCGGSWWYLAWVKDRYLDNMIDCLRGKSGNELVSLLAGVFLGSNFLYSGTAEYAPFVDGDVIPRDPRSLMADKAYLQRVGALDRDYIMGVNNNEGLLRLSFVQRSLESFTRPESALTYIRDTAAPMFPSPLNLNDDVLDMLNYQYSYPRDSDNHAPVQGLLDVASDAQFVLPTVQFARALTKASARTNVYLYLFDHFPQKTNPNSPLEGTTHAFEVNYEFDRSEELIQRNKFYAIPLTPSDGEF